MYLHNVCVADLLNGTSMHLAFSRDVVKDERHSKEQKRGVLDACETYAGLFAVAS